MLDIKNLNVSFDGKKLLSDINLNIAHGARHLLAGHNGSGKSSLVQTIAGNPAYSIDSGTITFDGRDITNECTTTRALLGIFLGAQNVPEIPGLTVLSFLKHSCAAHTHFNTGRDLSMGEFLQRLESAREQLNIPKDWLNRYINVGFSGGERKRLMLLQLIMTNPKLAILDEPDSGADGETQDLIAQTIANMPNTTFLFISHQTTFTDRIKPTGITTLSSGQIMIK
ncbi:MAG: ATP-binding cassette domain-containing protein [Alphaproteobacteria bacterium]|nr:ATP-binding cassette domain-containing protein [Alphaproteobacteria bacterium]MBQ8729447.1 ATP-binding cassette domain-containing protein [Alphaproteobacteria bacterium]